MGDKWGDKIRIYFFLIPIQLLVFRLGALKKRAESGKVGAQRQWDVLSETHTFQHRL
jgi:hypothetical protein